MVSSNPLGDGPVMKGNPHIDRKIEDRAAETRLADGNNPGFSGDDRDPLDYSRITILDGEELHMVVETFKALASRIRLRIISTLLQRELNVGELAEFLGLSVSATSHQLQLLHKVNVLNYRTKGKLVYYRPHNREVLKLIDDCVRHIQERRHTSSSSRTSSL